MKKLLAIYSSLNSGGGNSSKLARMYIDQLASSHQVDITELDLMADGPGHLTEEEMESWRVSDADIVRRQQELKKISEAYIAQLQAADEIVLAVPMYNFGIPSVLKSWLDRVLRAGVTFKYTEAGPLGLLVGKRVTVLAARGGIYAGTPVDTQTPYLKTVFNFIGIDDVRFVYAEGLNMREESAKVAFANAREKIIELTQQTGD